MWQKRISYICYICVIYFDLILAQGAEKDTEENTSTSRPVNLFIINDGDNEVANKSVTTALNVLKEKYPDYLGEVYIVQVNESDPNHALDEICIAWDRTVRNIDNKTPDFLLDITTSGLAAEIVNSFSISLGIPTLSAQYGQEGDLRYWRNLDVEKRNYLIQVMPPADLVPQAIRQLAIDLVISNAAVLFDDNFIMDHKYKSLFLNVPTRHVMNHIGQTMQLVKQQLSRLRDQDIVNFFVLGNEKTLSSTLDAAQALNFTGRKYGWFALTMNDFTPHCECHNISVLFVKPQPTDQINQNLAKFSPKLMEPTVSSAFYYDLVLLGVQAVKTALQNGEWFIDPPHISCDAYNGNNTPSRMIDFLSQLKATSENFVPTYSEIKWGKKNGQHRASFDMSIEVVNIVNANVVSTNVGNWTAGIDSQLKITSDVNHTAVTSYRVVTVIHPPFVIYDEKTKKWSGYCIDLLEEIRQYVQFEYDIREVEDKSYGHMEDDGSWNGIIKELVEKRADIGLGSLWVMAERENVVDFTVPYYDLVGLTILMLKPKAPTSLFKFLTVLEDEVWFCILAAYFFTSGLMWAFDRWSPYSYQNNREKYKDDDEKREFNLRECLWFCMTSLTPQGGGEAPKNLSGRLVAATWWLFGFIIIASYTANLAAFLTVSRLDTPIESLDDLSKQYKIQYAPAINSSAYIYFQRMADIESRFYEIWKDMSLNDSLTDLERSKLAVWDYPVSDKYTKMFQAMKEAGFPASEEEALMRVRHMNSTNDFAYIGDATTIKYLVMTNCDLIQVGDEFSKKPYAIAVQQGSPLKDQFNDAILILLNKRKLEKMKDNWWKKNPLRKTCEKEDDQSDGISIQNIGGVFIVIFVGIALACVTLAFEYWWYKYRPRIRNSKVNSSPKIKVTKIVKPIRFTLQPAPTHGIHPAHFRSRF